VTVQLPEIFSIYGERVRAHPDRFGPKFRNRILAGGAVSAVDYVQAKARQRKLTEDMAQTMADLDVLVTAGSGPAPLLEESAAIAQLNRVEITVPFSFTGFPALSVCIGFNRDDLPLSMQIAGKPFDEVTVLQIGNAYESATPWRSKRPQRGLASRA